jgi:hypothetical protein
MLPLDAALANAQRPRLRQNQPRRMQRTPIRQNPIRRSDVHMSKECEVYLGLAWRRFFACVEITQTCREVLSRR